MRNPFRLRAAQRSVSDDQFVKLFGAGALELIDELEDPWGGLVFLRSAPGGGKTSFLRLLTPRPLKLASLLTDDASSRPTYDALRKRGAIDENGPCLLGVMATFTPEYRDMEEIDRGGGLFRSLLNARIVIATMRAILERSDRSYPDDLDTISATWSPDVDVTIPASATGRQLYDWAAEIERTFYDRLDDFDDIEDSTGGHVKLDALSWFATAEFKDAHGIIGDKRLLLLDDLQYLSVGQRQSLTDLLTSARADCGIWVAERMEALNHQEILSEGVLRGRDFNGVVQLENRWAGRLKSYSKFVSQIAELRAHQADGFEDRDLFASIAEIDDAAVWNDRYEEACQIIEKEIQERVKSNTRYNDWIKAAEDFEGTPFDRAKRWRSTRVLIERDMAKTQVSFGFDILSDDEFAAKDSSGMRKAAEHFLRSEFKAPLYFGKETLAAVSSTNVDQYVEVAGDIFEEISAKITGPRSAPTTLSTTNQHRIIKESARKRWEAMPRRLPHGYEARRLLEAAGTFCRTQTFRATAPYAPGVTGFAISMEDRARLIDQADSGPDYYRKLRDVLTSLVAHNLVAPRLDHKNKNREYVVFYINRLVCVHFDLPLGYGGWREKPLSELSQWIELGKPAVKEARLVE
ncbi:hypothetical protein [Sphingorhabdus sp. EL138]|uniref:ORC-CDC6 family AAA ATPase n=1 Tax=Sphingorhabdus sp. EL138 TaxID=2073156 RepID=UPI000D69E02A|nr:hypothetical protein [Sphingorhabdus sp. EL138]